MTARIPGRTARLGHPARGPSGIGFPGGKIASRPLTMKTGSIDPCGRVFGTRGRREVARQRRGGERFLGQSLTHVTSTHRSGTVGGAADGVAHILVIANRNRYYRR